MLPEQTLKAAASTADHLRKTVENLRIPHESNSPPGLVIVSAGVAALSRGDTKSSGELLEHADAALYTGPKKQAATTSRYTETVCEGADALSDEVIPAG